MSWSIRDLSVYRWIYSPVLGRLEHWDVNNENLHGQWFQNRLNDFNYDLEIFREMYTADQNVKLFLNDYDVVGGGGATGVSHVIADHFGFESLLLYIYH